MVNFPSSGTGGYPYSGAADCSKKYGPFSWCINGYDFSPYKYGYRNCTDYVAWVLASLGVQSSQYGGLGNAATWGTRAASHHVVNNSTPGIGSVAVNTTSAGGLGHVAFVTAISGNVITVSEYNQHGDGTYSTQTGTAAKLGFTSFDHFEQYETGTGTGPGPGGASGGYDLSYVNLNYYTGNGQVVTYSAASNYTKLVQNDVTGYPATTPNTGIIPLYQPNGDLSFVNLNYYTGNAQVVTYSAASNYTKLVQNDVTGYPATTPNTGIIPLYQP